MNPAGNPVTYLMLYGDRMLDGQTMCGVDPNAAVTCNCNWDNGHEAHCDIVAANELLRKLQEIHV